MLLSVTRILLLTSPTLPGRRRTRLSWKKTSESVCVAWGAHVGGAPFVCVSLKFLMSPLISMCLCMYMFVFVYVPAGIAPSIKWSQVRVRYRLYELPPISHRVATSVVSVIILKSSVLLLEDLVGELEKQGLTFEGARAKVDRIFSDLAVLTAELFRVSEVRSIMFARGVISREDFRRLRLASVPPFRFRWR